MINFSFDIAHPFETKFKNFWCKSWPTPFKTKFIELELHTIEHLAGWNFHLSTRCDHAGLDIQLSLFGVCLHFNFYDNRHWDYDNNTWEVYADSQTNN